MGRPTKQSDMPENVDETGGKQWKTLQTLTNKDLQKYLTALETVWSSRPLV